MSSPPTLLEAGRTADDLEPLEVVDKIDQRLTKRLALARQQQIDDAERILRRERIHQPGSDLGRACRATVVARDDLADSESAGADERDDGDQAADNLALAALADRTCRHDGGRRRIGIRGEGLRLRVNWAAERGA